MHRCTCNMLHRPQYRTFDFNSSHVHLTLAPSDIYLFCHLKKHFHDTRFCDKIYLMQANESHLNSTPVIFYLSGIKKHFDRYQKGNYTKK